MISEGGMSGGDNGGGNMSDGDDGNYSKP